jgi:hypothetical protein
MALTPEQIQAMMQSGGLNTAAPSLAEIQQMLAGGGAGPGDGSAGEMAQHALMNPVPATSMYDLTPYGMPGSYDITPREFAAAQEQWNVSQGLGANDPGAGGLPPQHQPPGGGTNNPPPQHSDPIPPPFTGNPSGPEGWPVSPPPSQGALNNVWTGQNSSSGGWPAAPVPTFPNAPAPATNAISMGDVPGRTADGLLSPYQAENYIQGLLGKLTPGNWKGGQADIMSSVTPPSTPLLAKRQHFTGAPGADGASGDPLLGGKKDDLGGLASVGDPALGNTEAPAIGADGPFASFIGKSMFDPSTGTQRKVVGVNPDRSVIFG